MRGGSDIGGEHVQWFIADKHGRLLLSSGKLSALQAYMNAHATSPQLAADCLAWRQTLQ